MVNNSNQPVAVVTGASSGIGKEISIQLAKYKFNLILIARSENKLLNIKKEIEQIGPKCQIIVLDVSSKTMIQDLKSNIKNFENVQILINNAGIGIFDKIEDVTFEDWEKQINTNGSDPSKHHGVHPKHQPIKLHLF